MAIPPTEKEPTLADRPSLAQTGWLLEAQGTGFIINKHPQTLHSKLQGFPLDLDTQYIQLLKTQIGTCNKKLVPQRNNHSSNVSN